MNDLTQDEDANPKGQRGDTIERAANAIRGLIISRELFPGEQLRQDDLSARIGISRGPTREALQALSKEGMVTHARNRGYTVTRFNFSDIEQLYTLRDLAESELLGAVRKPTKLELSQLRRINKEIRAPKTTFEQAVELNREFHFTIFNLSDRSLIVQEIDRWWKMSMAYQALGMGVWSERAVMMSEAHDAQLDALVAGDHQELIKLSREHRQAPLKRIQTIIR